MSSDWVLRASLQKSRFLLQWRAGIEAATLKLDKDILNTKKRRVFKIIQVYFEICIIDYGVIYFMDENIKDQQQMWDIKNKKRTSEHKYIEMMPNDFARKCITYIPENGFVLEIGAGNARDARFFAREKSIHVFAIDFSTEATKQASVRFAMNHYMEKYFRL